MMKNSRDLQKELLEVVRHKFYEQYPEIFIKVRSLDADELRTAPEGYDVYMKYVNSISRINHSPGYRITSYDFIQGNDQAKDMVRDAKDSDDILKFCFLNIPI